MLFCTIKPSIYAALLRKSSNLKGFGTAQFGRQVYQHTGKVEAACSSKPQVSICTMTWQYITED